MGVSYFKPRLNHILLLTRADVPCNMFKRRLKAKIEEGALYQEAW